MSDSAEHASSPEGPPTPKKRRARRRTRAGYTEVARVPRFDELGPMPTHDALAMNNWVHKALGISAAQVVKDPDLTDSQRRSQLCDIASKMSGLTDQSRIFGAENVVRGHEAGLKDGTGPVMESTSDAPEAVTSASGARTARRGRPRKRGLG